MNAFGSRFVLYQRDDCHLCDLALAMLSEACFPEFDSIFIDEELGLEAVYGHRVPVLRDTRTGLELDWPFSPSALIAWRYRAAPTDG
jgi:hypothetical protein